MGDEPGVYGDAHYTGLCTEWPLTLRKFNPTDNQTGSVQLRLEAENVRIHAPPAQGHPITLSLYTPEPTPSNPYQWKKETLTTGVNRLLSNQVELAITLPADRATSYISVRLEVDTSVSPGLYDEFVVTKLSIFSTSHYASFGFQYEARPAVDT